jgi:hypothetical protein
MTFPLARSDNIKISFVDYLKAQPDVEIKYFTFEPNHRSMGMGWRFLPAGDPEVDVFIVRDLDSRLSFRERFGVRQGL